MRDGDIQVVAIDALERLLDKEYAVAFRKAGRKVIHIRAVRDGNIVEAECASIEEAVNAIYDRVRRKAEVKS
jgi:hypothetical protein